MGRPEPTRSQTVDLNLEKFLQRDRTVLLSRCLQRFELSLSELGESRDRGLRDIPRLKTEERRRNRGWQTFRLNAVADHGFSP